jgi:hypothetical protein
MDPPIRREYFNVKAFVDVNSWRLAEDCGETDAPDVTVPDAGRKQVIHCRRQAGFYATEPTYLFQCRVLL